MTAVGHFSIFNIEVITMVDNFELIKSMLKFNLPEHFYFVQLLKRQSDDPMKDGKKNPTYHGDMHSRSLKNYFIRKPEDLDKYRDEIINLCNTEDVRAYIRLNRRSNKDVSMKIYERIYACMKGGTYKNPERLLSSACGKSNSEPKETKSWLIDVDKEYLPYLDDLIKLVNKCKSQFTYILMKEIHSKSGIHLIVHPFNKDDYKKLWTEFRTTHPDAPETAPKIHQDNPTILYVK